MSHELKFINIQMNLEYYQKYLLNQVLFIENLHRIQKLLMQQCKVGSDQRLPVTSLGWLKYMWGWSGASPKDEREERVKENVLKIVIEYELGSSYI